MPLPPLSSSARRFGHLRTLLLLLLVVLPTLGLVPQDVAFSALPDLELDLGSAYGLTGEGVAQATVMTVTQGAEKKNKESVYFLGLLHLYGAGGMQEDHEKGVASVREAQALTPWSEAWSVAQWRAKGCVVGVPWGMSKGRVVVS
mgnify:CR=1 FL=1